MERRRRRKGKTDVRLPAGVQHEGKHRTHGGSGFCWCFLLYHSRNFGAQKIGAVFEYCKECGAEAAHSTFFLVATTFLFRNFWASENQRKSAPLLAKFPRRDKVQSFRFPSPSSIAIPVGSTDSCGGQIDSGWCPSSFRSASRPA